MYTTECRCSTHTQTHSYIQVHTQSVEEGAGWMPIFIFIMQMEQKKIRSLTRRQAVVVSQQPKPSLHRLNSNEIHRDKNLFFFISRFYSLYSSRGPALHFFRMHIFSIILPSLSILFHFNADMRWLANGWMWIEKDKWHQRRQVCMILHTCIFTSRTTNQPFLWCLNRFCLASDVNLGFSREKGN